MRDKDHANTSGAAWRSFNIECAENARVKEAQCASLLCAQIGVLLSDVRQIIV